MREFSVPFLIPALVPWLTLISFPAIMQKSYSLVLIARRLGKKLHKNTHTNLQQMGYLPFLLTWLHMGLKWNRLGITWNSFQCAFLSVFCSDIVLLWHHMAYHYYATKCILWHSAWVGTSFSPLQNRVSGYFGAPCTSAPNSYSPVSISVTPVNNSQSFASTGYPQLFRKGFSMYPI